MEAAADLIVHTAAGHHRQRRVGHLARARILGTLPVAQDELPDHRLRKLRRAAETAVGVVELRRDGLQRLPRDRGREELGRRPEPLRLAERRADLLRRGDDLAAPVRPRVGDRRQEAREPGQSVTVDRREVRAAVEGCAIGSQKHGHGPPAVSRQRLDGLHVDLVDVWTLLAIDLDVDEVLVHHAGDLGILERLVLHHVAPVARRVADREEHGLVLGPGLRECLVAPGIPVDGVVGMLEQIGAGLACEPVFGQRGASDQRWNGSALTLAAVSRPSWRTDTLVPGWACWRRTNASAIGRSSPTDHTALVTLPIAVSSATTSAPADGTSRPSSTRPRSIRLTCPRSRILTTTS